MSSLAERFAVLANTTPVFEDPEDEINLETTARLDDSYIFESSVHVDDVNNVNSSRLRRKNIALLSDGDGRYSGKKISRKNWRIENEDNTSSVSENGSDDEDMNISAFKNQFQKQSNKNYDNEFEDEAENDEDEDEEDEDEDEDDDSDSEEDENDLEDDIASESTGTGVIQNFSKLDIGKEMDKGKAVQAQLGLWDKLLEIRIKLQKMLVIANRLPNKDSLPFFEKMTGKELTKPIKEGRKNMKKLLDKLFELQEELLERNPETKHVLDDSEIVNNQKLNFKHDDDDEEINSDTDQEMEEPTVERKLKRKLNDLDYPELLEKRHKNFATYRNNTIQRWNERTRMASGKLNQKSFSAFEQSALKQIEQILMDKNRLRRRTQLKRTVYRVLGKKEIDQKDETGTEIESLPKVTDHLKDYDCEIFDDSDFYHQLLRELIERKTANVSDPVALSRQWLEIQKLRGKIKRKIDTKASKGRKIRYDVLPKLVNFMAPTDYTQITDDARNELFGSVFGQRSYAAL